MRKKSGYCFIFILTAAVFFTGCATAPREAPADNGTGNIPAADSIASDISKGSSDEKPAVIEILPPDIPPADIITAEPVPDIPVIETEPVFTSEPEISFFPDQPEMPFSETIQNSGLPVTGTSENPINTAGVSNPVPEVPPPVSSGETLPVQGNSPPPEGGIWEYEPSYPYISDDGSTPVQLDSNPSRSITIRPDQYIDILYPGSGWIYLGDTKGGTGVLYYGKKLENKNTLFTLRGKQEGIYTVQFYKQDLLADNYIDDTLQIIVSGAPYTGTEHIAAPLYTASPVQDPLNPSAVASKTAETAATPDYPPLAAAASAAASLSGVSSILEESLPAIIQIDESTPAGSEPVPKAAAVSSVITDLQPAELLAQARNALASKDAVKALELLDEFFKKSVTNLDEGWYLRGQAYEASGDTKNIRKALDAYQTLTEAYPGSTYWNRAKDRITYINRFYFSIR